eukprot:SAG11_NODE_1066_length_5987_cov_3.977412_1_plen_248_part_00
MLHSFAPSGARASLLCSTVHIQLEMASGGLEHQQQKARDAVLRDGVGLLPGCLSADRVAALRASATADLAALRARHAARVATAVVGNPDCGGAAVGAAACAPCCDYAELLERGGGRLDMRYRLHARPWSAPDLAYNKKWFRLVAELLGCSNIGASTSEATVDETEQPLRECCLLYMGIMFAAADTASPQIWHQDGAVAGGHCDQWRKPIKCLRLCRWTLLPRTASAAAARAQCLCATGRANAGARSD